MKRGEVVAIEFPFSDGSGVKHRPALVVQSDAIESPDTVLAMISSTQSDTSILLTPDPKTGIKQPCFVRCEKLYSIEVSALFGSVGRLSKKTMQQVDACLRNVLGI